VLTSPATYALAADAYLAAQVCAITACNRSRNNGDINFARSMSMRQYQVSTNWRARYSR
jgi:predicted outer membrane protein